MSKKYYCYISTRQTSGVKVQLYQHANKYETRVIYYNRPSSQIISRQKLPIII